MDPSTAQASPAELNYTDLTIPFTSDQNAKYKRYVRRCNTLTVEDGIAQTLLDTAINWLDYYPMNEETESIPPQPELFSEFRANLPSTLSLFTTNYFLAPTSTLSILKDIAILYKLPDPTLTPNNLDMDIFERQNPELQLHLWLASLKHLNIQGQQILINDYRMLNRNKSPSHSPSGNTPNPFEEPRSLFGRESGLMPNVTRRNRNLDPEPSSEPPPSSSRPPRPSIQHIPPAIPTQPETPRPEYPNPRAPDFNASKNSTTIINYFRDSQFSGNVDESIILTIRDFDNISAQLFLHEEQKALYFPNCFREPAKTFFFMHVSPGDSYENMAHIMKRQFDNDASRLQVQTRLDSLHLRSFMTRESITDDREGLTSFISLIDKLSQQCMPSFRNDDYRLRILSRGVSSFSWSVSPRSQLLQGQTTYLAFQLSLFATMTLDDENKREDTIHTPPSPILTNYGQYGTRPATNRNFNRTTNNYRNQRPAYSRQPFSTNNRTTDRNSCRRCGFIPWKPGHRCAREAIRSHITERLTDGEDPALIMGELVADCELDITNASPAIDELQPSASFITAFQEHTNLLFNEENAETPHNSSASSVSPDEAILTQHINYSFHCSPSDSISLHPTTPNPPRATSGAQPSNLHVNCDHIPIRNAEYGNGCKATRPVFCVDSGAPRSVMGMDYFTYIHKFFNTSQPQLIPSSLTFSFAKQRFPSLGKVSLILTTPDGTQPITIHLDVVSADVPPLLGLDVLDLNKLMIDNVHNRLARRSKHYSKTTGLDYYVEQWFIPLLRGKSGHLYCNLQPPDFQIRYSRPDLLRLHRQFYHPSAGKLFALLNRADPSKANAETLRILHDIGSRCDPCQRVCNAPLRFRVSFGSDSARFNERIFMDIVYINNYPILHIVDEGTRYSAAVRLLNQSTSHIWTMIIRCWAGIYTGMPNRIIVDQGTCFGPSFVRLAEMSGVKVEHTGTESHNSLGIGERYHQPLRNTLRKMFITHPKADFDTALALATKALNDTLGPEGLVPSALVFGDLPRLQLASTSPPQPRPTTDERASLADIARTEMATIMAKLRIQRAFRHQTPPSSDHTYNPGDQVLVWREKQINHRIGEFLGPFTVTSFNKEQKLVYIQDTTSARILPFSTSQVKPYLQAPDLTSTFMTQLNESLTRFRSPSISDDIFVAEIIRQSDPRSRTLEMRDAKQQEIRNLFRRGTFQIVLKEEVPDDANILPGRFVMTIKSTVDGSIKHKARFVVGGHRDKLKQFMVHSSQTLQPQSIRLLLALATAFGFDIWTSDVTQAYLQSSLPLARDLFLNSNAPELQLTADQCLKLLKPLYGLCESGDLWFHTLARHHQHDLGMQHLASDTSLHYLFYQGVLAGLSGAYVDDLLRAGNAYFRTIAHKTNQKFDMAGDEQLPADFSGFRIDFLNGILHQTQQPYLSNLEKLDTTATFTNFRSMRMKLAWLSHTRPDCLFEISRLAQITEKAYTDNPAKQLKLLNNATTYATSNPINISFPQLDKRSLQLLGYSDASFASNHDLSSQLGYIILLSDNTDKVIPIAFKSYKAKRICRSAMAAEVIAFSDMFDAAHTLASELQTLTSRITPLQLFTDNKSLFDTISRGSRTSEKRLMLDVFAAREGYKTGLISDIGFVRSQFNLADGLTKAMSQAAIRSILSTNRHTPSCEQWILRPSETTPNTD